MALCTIRLDIGWVMCTGEQGMHPVIWTTEHPEHRFTNDCSL